MDVGVREREEGSVTPKKTLECLPELMPCFLELPGIEVPHSAGPCWLDSLCADRSMGRKGGQAVILVVPSLAGDLAFGAAGRFGNEG